MASVFDVAKMFISLSDEDGISNLKLQKLVYYAQGFCLALYDQPLFENNIEAWAHGPVSPSLYHEYKSYGKEPITLANNFNPDGLLSDLEVELIEEVYEVFGQFSAWKLRNMTHEESPWLKNEAVGGVISHQELRDYFNTRIG